jgi:hypothetical protein
VSVELAINVHQQNQGSNYQYQNDGSQQQDGGYQNQYNQDMNNDSRLQPAQDYQPRFSTAYPEMRPNHNNPKYKTKTCTNWLETGSCKFGENCAFLHEHQDSRRGEYGQG